MGERNVLVIEIGHGVDLRGQDATKAATRAVRDAVGSNGLPGLRLIRETMPGRLTVLAKIALPDEANPIDEEAIKALLPVGDVSVQRIAGGVRTPLHYNDDHVLVAVAVVEVALET